MGRRLLILSALFGFALAAPAPDSLYGSTNTYAGGVYASASGATAAAVHLPPTYSTHVVSGQPTVSVHQPAAKVTKQIHYQDRTYVAGYDTAILKPAIPDFRIAVPNVLLGSQSIRQPLVSIVKQQHVVNEPYGVDKPYDVPYEVLRHVQRVQEVPTPVHVLQPYPVPHPVPVVGQPIVHRVFGRPLVHNQHQQVGFATAVTPQIVSY